MKRGSPSRAPTKKTKKAVKPASSPTSKHLALKRTAVRAPVTKGELKYLRWGEVELETLNPLLQRQLIVGHNVMLTRVLLKKGCIVPLHSHVNEQLSYILEGALKFWIDGREIVVHAGEVLTIPSNMPHKAEALEDTVDLDIFNPPRADWINKTDSYLRNK
jgi:quercetin dioxygenase-like cupin family protein